MLRAEIVGGKRTCRKASMLTTQRNTAIRCALMMVFSSFLGSGYFVFTGRLLPIRPTGFRRPVRSGPEAPAQSGERKACLMCKCKAPLCRPRQVWGLLK